MTPEQQAAIDEHDMGMISAAAQPPICGVHAHYGAQHAPSLGCNEVCTELKGHDGGKHDT